MNSKYEENMLKSAETHDDQNRIIYLQFVQNIITRMSTTSGIFKGFTAALFTGIITIKSANLNLITCLFLVIPLALFTMSDVYYLRLERKYRAIYDMIRTGIQPVDFNLDPNTIKIPKDMQCRLHVLSCLKSVSIWPFYTTLWATWLVVIIAKVCIIIVSNH